MLQGGQSSRLSAKRLSLLNKLGFVWEVDRATSRLLKDAVLNSNYRSEYTPLPTTETNDTMQQAQHMYLSTLSNKGETDESGALVREMGATMAAVSTSVSDSDEQHSTCTTNVDSKRHMHKAEDDLNAACSRGDTDTEPACKRRRSSTIKPHDEKTKG